MDGPGFGVSAVMVGVSVVLAGLANWQSRRPIDRRLWPVIPWLGVQFVSIALFLVFGAHLVSLLSGHHFFGRNGY